MKDRNMKKLIIFITSIFLLFTLCGNDETQEKEINVEKKIEEKLPVIDYDGEINIGLNLPKTGPYKEQGLDELRAFELAAEEINSKGGIYGKKVNLVVKDSKSNPEISKTNVRELIDVDKAVMITGGVSSAVASVTSDICKQKKVLHLIPIAYSNHLTGKDTSRYTFRKSGNAYMCAKTLAKVLTQYYGDGTKYAYIVSNYSWGWSTESSLRNELEKAGAETVLSMKARLGTEDYNEYIELAAKENPDVLVLVLFGNDLVNAIKRCYHMELKKHFKLIVVPLMELNMAINSGIKPLEGIISTTPWYWKLEEFYKETKLFNMKFFEKYKKYPSHASESAYVCLMEYARAVGRVNSFATADVIKALEGHEFFGLKDRELWRDFDHQAIQSMLLIKGKNEDEMENEWDFFKIINDVPGMEITRTKDMNNDRVNLDNRVNSSIIYGMN